MSQLLVPFVKFTVHGLTHQGSRSQVETAQSSRFLLPVLLDELRCKMKGVRAVPGSGIG